MRVQVTARLAGLCVQAMQQPHALGHVQPLALNALNAWLTIAEAASKASLQSHAAATVRQQLQESGLLQHLGPGMDAAAAHLTAAVAAVADVATATAGGGSSSGSTTAVSSTSQLGSPQQLSYRVIVAGCCCDLLSATFQRVSCVLSQTGCFTLEAALLAAPAAAARLALTGLQACSRFQQLQPVGGSGDPLLTGLIRTSSLLAAALTRAGDLPGMLQSCPGAKELLLSPDLLPCLAAMSVVAVLGLDMRSDGGASAAATPAGTSSSSGMGSSMGPHLPGGQQQQQQQQQAGSSGVLLDSLTPLSCSLFDILGVTKETVLQAGGMAKSERLTKLSDLHSLLLSTVSVLKFQVSQCCSANTLISCQALCVVLSARALLHAACNSWQLDPVGACGHTAAGIGL
jgi:hypothetical protein